LGSRQEIDDDRRSSIVQSNTLKVQTAESVVIAGQKIGADLRLPQKKKSVA